MTTLNTLAVDFAKSNLTKAPTIRESFNALLEGVSSNELLLSTYVDTLSTVGKEFFFKLFSINQEEVTKITSKIKNRSVKLRKTKTTVAKRHKRVITKRATKGLFTNIPLVKTVETYVSNLLRRVGVNPTSTPIEELLSISIEEAGFLFKTESLFKDFKTVARLVQQVLAA